MERFDLYASVHEFNNLSPLKNNVKTEKYREVCSMKKMIPWLLLLAVLGGCSRGMTGCAVGAVTGASVGANATGAIVFGTLVGCTVGYNL